MYHFIVNNTSGGGRSKRVWEELQNYLLEHEIRYKAHFTEYEGHARSLQTVYVILIEKKCILLWSVVMVR